MLICWSAILEKFSHLTYQIWKFALTLELKCKQSVIANISIFFNKEILFLLNWNIAHQLLMIFCECWALTRLPPDQIIFVICLYQSLQKLSNINLLYSDKILTIANRKISSIKFPKGHLLPDFCFININIPYWPR